MTVVLPNVSTAGSFFTMACFFTILCTPIARTMVDTAANPSGIAATAKLTEVINISKGSAFLNSPIQNMTRHITNAPMPNIFPVCPNFFCKGV